MSATTNADLARRLACSACEAIHRLVHTEGTTAGSRADAIREALDEKDRAHAAALDTKEHQRLTFEDQLNRRLRDIQHVQAELANRDIMVRNARCTCDAAISRANHAEAELAEVRRERDKFAVIADGRHNALSAEKRAHDDARGEVLRLRAMLDDRSTDLAHWGSRATSAESALAASRAEVARLKEALGFYADPDTWDGTDGDGHPMSARHAALDDNGQRARAALHPTAEPGKE